MSAEYAHTAIEHGKALESGNYKRCNRFADSNLTTLRLLRETEDHGLDVLTELLEHGSPWVRSLAAVDLLRQGNEAGIPVLQEIAADLLAPVTTRFGCKIALEQWQKGTLEPRE